MTVIMGENIRIFFFFFTGISTSTILVRLYMAVLNA